MGNGILKEPLKSDLLSTNLLQNVGQLKTIFDRFRTLCLGIFRVRPKKGLFFF